VERVLPSEEVKARMAGLAVGLATDCDRPEHDVEKIMQENLPGANMLPFAAFITHDGKWVGGYSGYRDTEAFLKVLKEAEDTPYLKASKAVQKKLAGLADRAAKAAEKGDWKTVMRAVQDAAKTTGRCPERDALAGIEKRARAWAVQQLEAAVKAARSGDLDAAEKALDLVRKQFSGEPEAAEATEGQKALKSLALVVATEEKGTAAPGGREKAAQRYEGTRWAAIFTPGPADGQPPEDPGLEEGGG